MEVYNKELISTQLCMHMVLCVEAPVLFKWVSDRGVDVHTQFRIINTSLEVLLHNNTHIPSNRKWILKL